MIVRIRLPASAAIETITGISTLEIVATVADDGFAAEIDSFPASFSRGWERVKRDEIPPIGAGNLYVSRDGSIQLRDPREER